jgi:hypothetical protein
MRWGVYLGLVALQFAITYPTFSQTCQGPGGVVYILHHFFDVFVFWSFLFLTTKMEHIVHLYVILGVVLHWITNNYECIATTYMNELCGYPRDQWLDSMVNRIRPFYYTHIVWLGLLVAYDITWL